MPASAAFLFGIETECLTALRGTADACARTSAVARLLDALAQLAPSLPGLGGLFNGYGRVYLDGGTHLELASAESDSPYLLPVLVEQQQILVVRAAERLRRKGVDLILANNNHDGLLQPGAATWGAHENYLVEQHPGLFAEQMIPFLVSRIYAGAGGVLAPAGDFVTGVRAVFMETDVGGGTTATRAIHSTARQEHLLGPHPPACRYHLILGDGLRSHFGLALRTGATALALKAVFFNPGLVEGLGGVPDVRKRLLWLHALRRFNLLAHPGDQPRAHPLALAIQRHYLAGARRYADALAAPPCWVGRILDDWEATLDRLTRDDRDWLAAKLDPWIKYDLYTAKLRERGHGWQDVGRVPGLLEELALLDQSYHEFAGADSIFAPLERAGVLCHRVAEPLPPGGEPEPFIPQTATRARTRARFLAEHQGRADLVMDWAAVTDLVGRRRRRLELPFDCEYAPWEPLPTGSEVSGAVPVRR